MSSSTGASILAAAAVAVAERVRYAGHAVEVEPVLVLGMEAAEHNYPPVCAGNGTAAAILAHLCFDDTVQLGLGLGSKTAVLLMSEVAALTALAFVVEKMVRVFADSFVMCSPYRRLGLAVEREAGGDFEHWLHKVGFVHGN